MANSNWITGMLMDLLCSNLTVLENPRGLTMEVSFAKWRMSQQGMELITGWQDGNKNHNDKSASLEAPLFSHTLWPWDCCFEAGLTA